MPKNKAQNWTVMHTDSGVVWTGDAVNDSHAVVFAALTYGWAVGDTVFVVPTRGMFGNNMTVPGDVSITLQA